METQEILTLKSGCVDTEHIEEYNKLQSKLKFWRKRLQCATGSKFNCECFILGDYGSSSAYEGEHFLILSHSRSEEDVILKQEIIDFLTVQIISHINRTIERINELVK